MTPWLLILPLFISFILTIKLFCIIKPHIKYSSVSKRLNLIIYGIGLTFVATMIKFILHILITLHFNNISTLVGYGLLLNFLIPGTISFAALGIISLLITSTELSSRKIQRISNTFIVFIFVVSIFILPIILSITFFCNFNNLQLKANNFNIFLIVSSTHPENISLYLLSALQLFSLTIGLISLKLNYVSKKFKKGKINYIINKTHLLYSFTNIFYIIYFIAGKITNNSILFSILNFISFLVPGILSLEFLLNEEWYRKDRCKYGIKQIMNNKELRKYFKDHLNNKKRIYHYNLIVRWEYVFRDTREVFSVEGIENLSKDKALNIFESELIPELDSFLFSKRFISYYSFRLIVKEGDYGNEIDLSEGNLM